MGEIEIICNDAFKWLNKQKNNSLPTIVTGIPDLDELEDLNLLEKNKNNRESYIRFFKNAVGLVLEKTNENQYAIFMQTDRKSNGEWIDKSYLTTLVAEELHYKLLWHKIIVNREGTYIQRPTYTHLLCYSKNLGPGEAFPDVLTCGQHLYKNGSPPNAICYVMDFLSKKKINKIIDPFSGRGTIPYIASLFNIDSLGIDIDKEQCDYAKELVNNKKMLSIVQKTDFFNG